MARMPVRLESSTIKKWSISMNSAKLRAGVTAGGGVQYRRGLGTASNGGGGMKQYPLVDLAGDLGRARGRARGGGARGGPQRGSIGGEKVAEFERAFADYLGVVNAIGVANGTDAIELSLKALNLAPGAEALVPANTFIATAEAVVAAGVVCDSSTSTLVAA